MRERGIPGQCRKCFTPVEKCSFGGWLCEKCRRIYKREVQKRSNAKHPETHKRSVKNYQQKKMQFVISQKERPCADCGIRYPSYVMDFDHVVGEKLGCVSRMINGHSIAVLAAEIRKCDVVCANCHRERTHRRQQSTIEIG